MKIPLLAVLVAGLLWSVGSAACQLDRDCSRGGKCEKDWDALDGICVGGARPGNDGDRQPRPQRDDPNHTAGNACYSNVECGPGSECLIGEAVRQGVCVVASRPPGK